MSCRPLLYAITVLTTICADAGAVTFSVDTQVHASLTPGAPLRFHTIRMSGIIEAGDADKLRTILGRLRPTGLPDAPLATMEMSSVGGDLLEGMAIGRLMREFHVASIVRSGDECLSACAIAFLGGTSAILPASVATSRSVEIGARVGFHSFYLNPNVMQEPDDNPRASRVKGFNEARGGAARLFRFAVEMGVEPSRIAQMIGRPPDVYDFLETAASFADYGVCPASLPAPRSGLAVQAANVCNHVMADIEPDPSPVVEPLTAAQTGRHLLEVVQRQMLPRGTRGALSASLASYPIMRNEVATARLYSDLRAAGVPLPELVGPVFRVGPYLAGTYDSHCVVSLSADSLHHLDVAITGPGGIAAARRSAPASCPGLFRYGVREVVNPSGP